MSIKAWQDLTSVNIIFTIIQEFCILAANQKSFELICCSVVWLVHCALFKKPLSKEDVLIFQTEGCLDWCHYCEDIGPNTQSNLDIQQIQISARRSMTRRNCTWSTEQILIAEVESFFVLDYLWVTG